MERFQALDNGLTMAAAIRSCTALGVSDGSFKLRHDGTAAMIIVDPTTGDPPSTTRMVGCHVTPGNPTDQSPYRSELSGIYGILCVVSQRSVCAT
jgi:hypothetical protein